MTDAERELLLTTARLLRELYREKPIQYEMEVNRLDRVLRPFETAAEDMTEKTVD